MMVLTGCTEDITGVGDRAAATSVQRRASTPVFRAAGPHVCFISVRERGGETYRYFRVPLHFAPLLTGEGGTTRYRYRGYQHGTQLAVVANCLIPMDERAATMLTRRLRGAAEPRHPGAGDDEARVQGCVTSGGGCALPGLVVNACQYGGTYPNCRDPFASEIPPCMDGGGCGGGEPVAGGGTGGTDPCLDCFPDDDPCEGVAPMIDDPDVQAGFAAIWARSRYGPNVPMTERREVGGWIIQSPDGDFRFEPFPDSWSTGPCGIDPVPPFTFPAGVVAWVHTHPYTRGERLTACEKIRTPLGNAYATYTNDPSFPDDSTTQVWRRMSPNPGLLGIVLDADSITAFDGTNAPTGSLVRFGRCGY